MHIRSILAAVAAAAVFSAPAFGAAIVNFSSSVAGTGNAATLSLVGTTSTAGGNYSSVLAFSDNARNGVELVDFPRLTVASSYYATGATGAPAFNFAYRITENPDRLQVTVPTANTATGTTVAQFDILALVYKQDFATLSTEQVVFDAGSSMSSNKSSLPAGATFNYVVKNGTTFYMSARQFTSADSAPLALSNLPGQAWVTFDPTANGGDISSLSSASSGGTTVTFNDVQAVGFYWEGATTATNSRTVATANWVVNASPVPEPSAIALLGGGLALGFLRRRKHA